MSYSSPRLSEESVGVSVGAHNMNEASCIFLSEHELLAHVHAQRPRPLTHGPMHAMHVQITGEEARHHLRLREL